MTEYLAELDTDLKAVLWDMDGTLADSEPLHEATFLEAIRSLGHVPPGDLHEKMLGRDEEASFAWLADAMGLDLSYRDWCDLRYRIYLGRTSELRVIPPAMALWQANEGRGLKQAVVSNSDRMLLEANLRATGLARGGLISVSRNDVIHGKPDAEPYLRAATLLGVEPSETAVIEDSATGVAAGLAAGMRVYFVRNPMLREHPEARPIFEFE